MLVKFSGKSGSFFNNSTRFCILQIFTRLCIIMGVEVRLKGNTQGGDAYACVRRVNCRKHIWHHLGVAWLNTRGYLAVMSVMKRYANYLHSVFFY